ncbi:MAG: aspartate-semialdehyde dehydrogenase [Planctomycetota bacterium]
MAERVSADVAVVGATGLVGAELLQVLAQRGHADGPAGGRVAAFARGGGDRNVPCGARALPCRDPDHLLAEAAPGMLVFLAVGAEVARALAPPLLARGARVVDTSSAFRADPDVPLCVPEVHGMALQTDPPALLASPNCSATLLVVALEPLRRAFGLAHVAVATYQAVSGAGRAAVDELRRQTRLLLDGGDAAPAATWPHACAFNVFPHESPLDAVGDCEEERKIVAEARRIWGLPDLPIDATCARVPVLRAHSQAVTVTLGGAADLDAVRRCLAGAPGLRLVDDPARATAAQATGIDEVLVARVRHAASERALPPAERRRVMLWLCGDQLRKGASLNAVQVAEAAGWLPPRAPA